MTDIAVVGIDLQPIKARLIDQVQALKKVAGAGALDAAMKNGVTAVPVAFLLPGSEQPTNDSEGFMNAVEQEVVTVFSVAVAVQSLADATGEAALDELRPMRLAIFKALIGWTYDEEFEPFIHAGGQIIGFGNGVLFWQDDFATSYQLQKTF